MDNLPEDQKYYVVYRCTNCHKEVELSFKRGELAPYNYLPCPNCGCETLRKVKP